MTTTPTVGVAVAVGLPIFNGCNWGNSCDRTPEYVAVLDFGDRDTYSVGVELLCTDHARFAAQCRHTQAKLTIHPLADSRLSDMSLSEWDDHNHRTRKAIGRD